jgi:hypothetical protein
VATQCLPIDTVRYWCNTARWTDSLRVPPAELKREFKVGVIGSAISGTPVAAGVLPIGCIVIDPTGTLLAVDNNTGSSISLYIIGSGGALTLPPLRLAQQSCSPPKNSTVRVYLIP